MNILTVVAILVYCTSLVHAGVIKQSFDGNFNSLQDQVQTALNNNNAAKAKQILQECSIQMKHQISTTDHDETRQNLMKTVNVFDKRLEEVKPDRRCSCDDIRKILGGFLLFIKATTGYGIGTVTAPVGLVSGGIKVALDTASNRLKKGDLPGTVSGALAGFTYKGIDSGVNNFYSGFRSLLGQPENKNYGNCDSFEYQIQTAIDNKDSAKVKQLLQNQSCQLKQRIPNEKDERSKQIMMKTVNSIDHRLKEIKPDQDCSCEDFQKFIKGLFLILRITAGFSLGTAISPPNGIINFVDEGIKTGLCRYKDGNLLGTVTGIPAGGFHGLVQGGGDGLFAGLGLPLQR